MVKFELELKNFVCLFCEDLMNSSRSRPFYHPCGGICCEKCSSPICKFCNEDHSENIKELKPLTDLLRKLIILCENHDRSAVFIETRYLLPYCYTCKGNKIGIDIEADFFSSFLDQFLEKVQTVNRNLFKFVVNRVEMVKNQENCEKLRISRALIQFLTGNALCYYHKDLKAIGVDFDLRFRCGFCQEVNIVDLSDLNECRVVAEDFVEKSIEDQEIKKNLQQIILNQEDIEPVKLVFEVLFAAELAKNV